MARSIVVVGSLNLDLVARVEHLPRAGETLAARSFASALGGKGANQAVACGRLGADVHMIGRVGTDSFGEQLRSDTAGAGVDVTCVEAVEGPSGLAMITIDEEAQNSITVVAGANEQLTPHALRRHGAVVRDAAVVLAQLETPIETVLLLSEMAQAGGIPLVLDPAPARALPPELLRRVTWLTPNESESRALLGDASLRAPDRTEEIALALLATGCRNVVLKLGAVGVFLAGADVPPTRVEGYRVDAVDTTAAGDAFNGAFAVALSEVQSPLRSAHFACAAAAISVTRHGAAAAMPNRSEVEAFMARNGFIRH